MSASWFHRLFSSRPVRQVPRRFRPAVEILEDRITLNNRFVVSAGIPIDNVTNFATLQAALTSTGLNSGDVIQIEPGSSPGNVSNIVLPSLTNLTIQGDPAAGLSSTPQFTVSDTTFTINPAQAGFTFKGVNIGLTQGFSGGSSTYGALTFNANGTITNCNIVDYNSGAGSAAITFDGLVNSQTDVLTNSNLTAEPGSVPTLLQVDLQGFNFPTDNVISGNTFVVQGPPCTAIFYIGSSATSANDDVTGNTFLDPGITSGSEIFVDVDAPVSFLIIDQNTFSMATGSGTAIYVSSSSGGFLVNILDNTINMIGVASPKGIDVEAGTSGTSAVLVENNRIQTGTTSGGIGLYFNLNTSSPVFSTVQGNDFHDNAGGVLINQNNGSVAGIDLGGGSQGSLGGNNFRGFTSATLTAGAIYTANGTGTLTAQRNIFSITPSLAVVPAGAAIDTSNNLTGNAAFVETLYIDFLHRAGDTTNSNDALYWINQLNSGAMNQSQVANALVRSSESLYRQVDALYLKILGRQADSGNTFFVNLLQNGSTLEQVTVDMATSPEYNALTGSDGAFIQSLYNKVLGRIGTNAEVQGWLKNVLPSMGRAGVANGILSSPEARDDAVEQLYGAPLASPNSVASMLPDLLHRTSPPLAADVNYWANGGLDLLSLEAAIAGTGDFFTNG